MTNEQKYIRETESLINFYRDKKANKIKEYIVTCHNYISELRNLDAIEIFTELEYEKAFNEVLSLVEETFRPNTFNSIINNVKLRVLDDEFIVYILGAKKQLKKRLKWNLLIELQFNYSMERISWLCRNGFNLDFENYAIKNITLNELLKLKP